MMAVADLKKYSHGEMHKHETKSGVLCTWIVRKKDLITFIAEHPEPLSLHRVATSRGGVPSITSVRRDGRELLPVHPIQIDVLSAGVAAHSLGKGRRWEITGVVETEGTFSMMFV